MIFFALFALSDSSQVLGCHGWTLPRFNLPNLGVLGHSHVTFFPDGLGLVTTAPFSDLYNYLLDSITFQPLIIYIIVYFTKSSNYFLEKSYFSCII